MHLIVTSIFWPLVYPTANKTFGMFDEVYFILAHGLTLMALIFEVFFSKIQFDRKIIKYLIVYTAYYFVFGEMLFEVFDYAVYDFMDLRVTFNRYLVGALPILIIVSNEIVLQISKLRNQILF